MTADLTQDAVDQYGRALLYIGSPDDYSIAVTRAGWAKHYIFNNNPVTKAAEIEAAQQAATAEKLGIWGAVCTPPPPPTTRQAPPPTRDSDNANVQRPHRVPPRRLRPLPSRSPSASPNPRRPQVGLPPELPAVHP